MQHRYPLLAILSLAVAGAACGYDNSGPGYDPPDNDTSAVAGSYEATMVTSTVNQTTTDLMAAGLVFTMTLKPDRTMTGRYVITTGTPAPGNPFDISGSWAQAEDSSVTISDLADTFISHVRFVPGDSGLVGAGVGDFTRFRMTLARRLER